MKRIPAYVVAFALSLSALAESAPVSWKAEVEEGTKHQAAGRWNEAERSYLSALSAARSLQPQPLPLVLLEKVSSFYMLRRQFPRAVEYLKQAIEVRASSADAQSDSELITDLNTIGGAYSSLGQTTDAINTQRRALDLLGKTSEHTVNGSLTHFILGMAHEREERLAEAEKDYQHALSILSRADARDDLTFVRISTALASLYMDLYRLGEAHQLLRRAVALLQKPQTRETVSFVLCLDIWAELLLREGKYTAAEEAWKSALSAQSPATEMSRLQVKSHLAEFHISMAEYKRAEVELREIANAWRDAGLKEDLLYARILTDLGVVRMQLRDYSGASELLERAERMEESQPEGLFRAHVLSIQGVLFHSRKQWVEAEDRFRGACEIRRRLLGANPLVAESMRSHALVLRKLNRKAEAKELEQQAKAILRHQEPQQRMASYTVDVRTLRQQR
jgi:tetratricopeptide (TPR) repeat protein